MIRLFSNTYNLTILILLLFTIGIRAYGLIVPYANTTTHIEINYLANLFNWLNASPFQSFILSTLTVFISALLLNYIILKNEIVFIPSYLTAYFFVIINSLFTDQMYFSPVHLVNLLMILSVGAILKIYQSENPLFNILVSSLLAGFSVLLNISYFAYFLVVLIGLNLFRPFTLRENLACFIGFAIPLYLGTMINYLVYDNFLPFRIFFPDYGNVASPMWALYSAIPILVMIGIFAFLRMFQNFFKNTTKSRRTIQLLVVILLVSLVLFITGKQNPRQEFSFVAFPLAIYFAFYFSSYRFKWLKEVINLILISSVLFFQYRFFWGI